MSNYKRVDHPGLNQHRKYYIPASIAEAYRQLAAAALVRALRDWEEFVKGREIVRHLMENERLTGEPNFVEASKLFKDYSPARVSALWTIKKYPPPCVPGAFLEALGVSRQGWNSQLARIRDEIYADPRRSPVAGIVSATQLTEDTKAERQERVMAYGG